MHYLELVNSQGILVYVNVTQIVLFTATDARTNSANTTMQLRDGLKLHLNSTVEEIVQLLDAVGSNTVTLTE
jgi:hypothetical protein